LDQDLVEPPPDVEVMGLISKLGPNKRLSPVSGSRSGGPSSPADAADSQSRHLPTSEIFAASKETDASSQDPADENVQEAIETARQDAIRVLQRSDKRIPPSNGPTGTS